MASALTVPVLGWVAKDTTSHSFPVGAHVSQQKTDPWRPDAGNGVTVDGRPVAPGAPNRTSVAAPPDWVARWVAAIRERDRARGGRSVAMYILDN